MIRLGLRLTLGSGREALLRMLITAAAVALGVGLLLFALGGLNGLHAQTDRGAWLDTSPQTPASTAGKAPSDRLWWLLTVDQFNNQAINRVDLAATGPSAPVPPGIAHLPGPGRYYASPALTALLKSEPANELRERFPGRQIGTIGAAALPSPSSLIIVIGHDARQLSQVPGAFEVRDIQQTAASCYNCDSGSGSGPVLRWILAGGAVVLVLPVIILIATASRLSAARREERFAAMRLVGATPRQISVIAAVEAIVAALAGVAAGFALFFLFRRQLIRVPFTGSPLAPGDLSLQSIDVVFVVIGVPIAAAVSARLALRRVRISPLGVNRRSSSAPPRFVRVVPLLAGIALIAYFAAVGKPNGSSGQIDELFVGLVLILVGLVLAGPWLTKVGSGLMTKRAGRSATLIAGRRLLDNPRAAFRSISGLVLALFITSAAIGTLDSLVATRQVGGGSASDTLVDPLGLTVSGGSAAEIASVSPSLLSQLRTTPGVGGVAVLHVSPSPAQRRTGVDLVVCDQLARTPAIGQCERGAAVAAIGAYLQPGLQKPLSATIWPAAHLSVADIASLPVDALVVATNGSTAAQDRVRTLLEQGFPFRGPPIGVDAVPPGTTRLIAMVRDMTDVVVVASLVIAACSLAVSIAAGLSDRRRPFSLLRLTGVSTGVLHHIVALESAVPLVLVAAVSIAAGLASAALYLHSQLGIALQAPGIAYWATVLGGLAASLAIIASTFPLLNRITGPEVARNE